MCAAPAQNAKLKFSGSLSLLFPGDFGNWHSVHSGLSSPGSPLCLPSLQASSSKWRPPVTRMALTVPSNRFLCFSFSCFWSAKRGGLEYLRYFPVSPGTKHSDYQTPSRIFGMDGPPILHTTATGSCLPSPPRKCW